MGGHVPPKYCLFLKAIVPFSINVKYIILFAILGTSYKTVLVNNEELCVLLISDFLQFKLISAFSFLIQITQKIIASSALRASMFFENKFRSYT